MEKDLSGVLVIDKEKGMTSHDVVSAVRKKFSIKKVGHAGTLDPNATGVLVLLVGKATKLSQKYSSQEKEYEATMKLGERTDSGDSEGNIISSGNVTSSEEEIKGVIDSFIGETEQVPPMVSAKQVGGKRLYKLARKGVVVEREPQKIYIKDIKVKKIDLPFVVFTVTCSKGTYIRQLADDVGEKLSSGAHLTELRRLRSGDFSLEDAVKLSDLKTIEEQLTVDFSKES